MKRKDWTTWEHFCTHASTTKVREKNVHIIAYSKYFKLDKYIQFKLDELLLTTYLACMYVCMDVCIYICMDIDPFSINNNQ